MDLTTTYLGLKLPHPLMPGASPLVDDIDTVRRLEDAGAAAIVMHSLFEEQIAREQVATSSTPSPRPVLRRGAHLLPEPRGVPPRPRRVPRAHPQGEAGRLRARHRLAQRHTTGGWLEYAKLIQQAGADALELNVYSSAPTRRSPARRWSCGRSRWCRRSEGRPHPGGGEALAVLHLARPLRHEARRGRRRRPRALQPLLPARHRRRGAGGPPPAAPLELGGTAAAACAGSPCSRRR